jgi:hypothetical protein
LRLFSSVAGYERRFTLACPAISPGRMGGTLELGGGHVENEESPSRQ